jgi:hypothetical protein
MQNNLKAKDEVMSKQSSEESFTIKHAKLTNVVAAANVFAWIVLFVHIVLVWARYEEAKNIYMSLTILAGESPDFRGMLREDLTYSASLFFELLGIFLRGVVYALVLKGISVGLNAILEIKLNQIAAGETGIPMLYKPQDVMWLEKWINRAAIAMIGITALVSIFNFSSTKQIASAYFINQPGGEASASIVAGVIITLNIIGVSALYYFLLRSLSSALKILMEIEFNSRRAPE